MGRTPNVIDEALLTESSSVVLPGGSRGVPSAMSNESQPESPATPTTPLERLYATDAPLVPDPVEMSAAQAAPSKPPAKSKPKPKAPPDPGPKTKAPPKTAPDPPVPKNEIIAHWPMNSDSVEGLLRAGKGEIELNQFFPAKPFDKVAPDPLPQTSKENPASLARGAWIEKEPSGKFELSRDASFALEGWVLISPDQAPVFIGGTHSMEGEPGWRLDMKPAATAGGSGGIRFLYSNGKKTITAQNNEIPLNQPLPHYFAAIWKHDAIGPRAGSLQVYFDGELVAQTKLPHSQIAPRKTDESVPPFRLSAAENPERIAMDEIRFTRGKLSPANFLSNEPFRPGGLVTESGLVRGRLLYAVDDGQFDYNDPYTKDNSAEIAPGSFKRVGYFVELGNDWVWVSMDRFQKNPKLVGVPRAKTKIVENGTVVKNLVIDSSREDLKALNRPGLTGIIEFWASNHAGDGKSLFGSNNARWDWKDSGGTTQPGFGSFQVFAFTNDKQTAAVTLFGVTLKGGAGIGDQDSQRAPDWTFGPGTKTYDKRNLEIWVGD